MPYTDTLEKPTDAATPGRDGGGPEPRAEPWTPSERLFQHWLTQVPATPQPSSAQDRKRQAGPPADGSRRRWTTRWAERALAHRNLDKSHLLTAFLVAVVGLTLVSGRPAGPLPAAMVRADAQVHSGQLVESIVRSLLATRAEAAAAAEQQAAEQAAQAPVPAPKRLPHGKGMWMWQVGQTEGGNVGAIVARAKATGLTHIYVRTGSEPDGFYAGGFLNQLLPAAHNAGLAVYGWDFPHMGDQWQNDVHRALATINYVTPDGHRLDGFSADIETESEGTHITAESAAAYGQALRAGAGDDYTLIATVPRPSRHRASFPFREVTAHFDAVAPMVYWLNREPGSDVAGAIRDLSPLGKPIFPVGQAYDGQAEGGRPGVPPPAELNRFMQVAAEHGATGVSFWSWQAADQAAWDTIKDNTLFNR